MELKNAEQQKAFIAEKQISYVRAIVILFGTFTFFTIRNPYINESLAYILIALIWSYGAFVLIVKPYQRYPIFLASWFTYISDCVFITLWVYATGGFYSPYHVIFHTSIIAVSFRFDLKTTLFTSGLYTVCYFGLLIYMDQLRGNEAMVTVRTGFIFITGFLTNLITKETLIQTEQKLQMKKLADEAQEHQKKLLKSQENLKELNTALQLRNEIFSHAEENALIGSYAWHIRKNKLEYSDNLFRLLGCEPGEFEPTFEKYLEFIHPDDREQSLKIAEETLEHKTFKTVINRIVTKDSKIRYLRVTGKFAGQGENELMIGTLQDITNDVLMNETIKAKNLELERSNNDLSSFNYIASHDLQEPVRKIHTFSNLILEKEKHTLSENAVNYLSRIATSANRMQRLIEAFLDYSRLGNSSFVFEKTDLSVIIAEVKNNLAELIQETGTKIETSGLPIINAVPLQMQQLFINLVSNAIKYRKKNEPPVIKINVRRVSGKEVEELGGNERSYYWKISVNDNGIGFEQQYAHKIFEVFQRLHSKEQYVGTGIGLAICKKIVESHRGFIKAHGKPGVGAVFEIYIPVKL